MIVPKRCQPLPIAKAAFAGCSGKTSQTLNLPSNQFWKGNEEYVTDFDVINSITFSVQLCRLCPSSF